MVGREKAETVTFICYVDALKNIVFAWNGGSACIPRMVFRNILGSRHIGSIARSFTSVSYR